jgi:hypothetical protein
MNVLVACEVDGLVRDAFKRWDHFALSCDISPSEVPGNHYQGNVLDILDEGWDLMIANPPSRYLSVGGLNWNKKMNNRGEKTNNALDFVINLMCTSIEKWAIFNPIGLINTRIRKPNQYIQPYHFGHNASKKTCIWLKGLPKLRETGPYIEPEFVNNLPRWKKNNSRFFSGWANAMAKQWRNVK